MPLTQHTESTEYLSSRVIWYWTLNKRYRFVQIREMTLNTIKQEDSKSGRGTGVPSSYPKLLKHGSSKLHLHSTEMLFVFVFLGIINNYC